MGWTLLSGLLLVIAVSFGVLAGRSIREGEKPLGGSTAPLLLLAVTFVLFAYLASPQFQLLLEFGSLLGYSVAGEVILDLFLNVLIFVGGSIAFGHFVLDQRIQRKLYNWSQKFADGIRTNSQGGSTLRTSPVMYDHDPKTDQFPPIRPVASAGEGPDEAEREE